MKQEDKDLLLKEICSRMPYGVMAKFGDSKPLKITKIEQFQSSKEWYIESDFGIGTILCPLHDIKLYLLPLSSMTEEQEEKYNELNCYELGCFPHIEEALDYLIENHFDYKYLIDKGLAIDATNLNIY